jgi:hypothetical protein
MTEERKVIIFGKTVQPLQTTATGTGLQVSLTLSLLTKIVLLWILQITEDGMITDVMVLLLRNIHLFVNIKLTQQPHKNL